VTLSSPKPSSEKLKRVKTSDAVVAYVTEAVITGQLPSGSRLDIDELAARLGVSRIPVREALIHLERDGLVRTEYHRGVYVETLDAAAVRDQYELYGVLIGLAASRQAARRDPATIAELEEIILAFEAVSAGSAEWEELSRSFVRVINTSTRGPRLRSLLRSFGQFIPQTFRMVMADAREESNVSQRMVLDAIKRGDGEVASATFVDLMRRNAERAVAALAAAGVLHETDDDGP
jgi:DNA-binding GntR family transcriptional regulator